MKGSPKQKRSDSKRDANALLNLAKHESGPAESTSVPVLFSVDEAYTVTGISRWSWRSWCYQGKIESVKIGKLLRIPASEIARLIAEGRRRVA